MGGGGRKDHVSLKGSREPVPGDFDEGAGTPNWGKGIRKGKG